MESVAWICKIINSNKIKCSKILKYYLLRHEPGEEPLFEEGLGGCVGDSTSKQLLALIVIAAVHEHILSPAVAV